jgi:hypothetical protein
MVSACRSVAGAYPGAGGQPGQQRGRLLCGQGVEADRGGVLECGQSAPAGDQRQAARRAGQQRPDLLVPGGVIEQQQDLLARREVTGSTFAGRYGKLGKGNSRL